MKLHRNSKIFINYFLGPLLFVWLAWSVWQEISRQPDLPAAWQRVKAAAGSYEILLPVAVILLMFVNWACEAAKWQLAVREVQKLSFFRSFKAVLSGVSFSVSTPNRVGEYLGRVLYMQEGNRLRTIAVTMLSSLSQLLITLTAGLAGLLFMKADIEREQLVAGIWIDGFCWGTALVTAGLYLFYFRLYWLVRLVEKIPFFQRYGYLVEAIGKTRLSVLNGMLLFSLLRYVVFLVQYLLLGYFFDMQLTIFQLGVTVSVFFLIMAVIPTFAIAELGIKGKVALLLMGIYSRNKAGIIFSTAGIWFINLVIPAVIGSLLILGLRKFYSLKES